MSRLSVPQAAQRLGVSPARVRQRIGEGSLVAEKVGGRWLVDLDASQARAPSLGRPVSPSSVWWSLASAEVAKAALPGAAATVEASKVQRSLRNSLLPRMQLAELVLSKAARASEQDPSGRAGGAAAADGLHVLAPGILTEALSLSRSSRSRAIHRFVDAVAAQDYPALLAWLSNRGSRRLFVVAAPDLDSLRADDRLVLSGVSHPDSGLEDPRMVEAYVSASDVDAVVDAYWLERPAVDERPNVVLHVVPVRPPAVGAMLLAADLAEHGGPREVQRAHELLADAIDVLADAHAHGAPDSGAVDR